MALQKLACLLTVFWARSMTICDPLAFGWNRSGLIVRDPPTVPHWMGRYLLVLWWHRWDVDGNGLPRESDADRDKERWALMQNKLLIGWEDFGLFLFIYLLGSHVLVSNHFEMCCITVGLCWLFVSTLVNKLISHNHCGPCKRKSKCPCRSRMQHTSQTIFLVVYIMQCSHMTLSKSRVCQRKSAAERVHGVVIEELFEDKIRKLKFHSSMKQVHQDKTKFCNSCKANAWTVNVSEWSLG